VAGRRLSTAITWAGSNAGRIMASQFPDDGRTAESSFTITTASPPLGSVNVIVHAGCHVTVHVGCHVIIHVGYHVSST
jgi:hypothetical protein